ncbi:hypothetical protein Sdagh_51440 [Streptomyces daghestanicus]|uniref:Uncharacterized protein n=1 Tax=Streptomyces daghestanicus TaxID=66885 RepID=A0ABQ3Q839_9ACTN|nr:hypothetical protein Sdagh_51440 [Streptomyces daghestanicus]
MVRGRLDVVLQAEPEAFGDAARLTSAPGAAHPPDVEGGALAHAGFQPLQEAVEHRPHPVVQPPSGHADVHDHGLGVQRPPQVGGPFRAARSDPQPRAGDGDLPVVVQLQGPVVADRLPRHRRPGAQDARHGGASAPGGQAGDRFGEGPPGRFAVRSDQDHRRLARRAVRRFQQRGNTVDDLHLGAEEVRGPPAHVQEVASVTGDEPHGGPGAGRQPGQQCGQRPRGHLGRARGTDDDGEPVPVHGDEGADVRRAAGQWFRPADLHPGGHGDHDMALDGVGGEERRRVLPDRQGMPQAQRPGVRAGLQPPPAAEAPGPGGGEQRASGDDHHRSCRGDDRQPPVVADPPRGGGPARPLGRGARPHQPHRGDTGLHELVQYRAEVPPRAPGGVVAGLDHHGRVVPVLVAQGVDGRREVRGPRGVRPEQHHGAGTGDRSGAAEPGREAPQGAASAGGAPAHGVPSPAGGTPGRWAGAPPGRR